MLAKFALTATGRGQVSNSLTPLFSIAGQAYSGTIAFIDDGAVAAEDSFNGGFRRTSMGALRVYDATAGLPANTVVTQGISRTSDGQVCFTTDAITTAFSLNGLSLTSDGRVYVDLL